MDEGQYESRRRDINLAAQDAFEELRKPAREARLLGQGWL
jgi:hypothetical protein